MKLLSKQYKSWVGFEINFASILVFVTYQLNVRLYILLTCNDFDNRNNRGINNYLFVLCINLEIILQSINLISK